MMRAMFFLLSAILLIWAGPARADVTAHYYIWGPLGPSMTIDVADNGDARIRLRDGTVAIRRHGVVYLIRGDDRGLFVIRQEEFARIEARKQRENGGLPSELTDMPRLRIVERGTEEVAGRRGIRLVPDSPDEPASGDDMAFVVTTDPDLAPVGPLVATFFGGGNMDIDSGESSAMREVHERGTLIRMAFLLRLERVEHEPIPVEAFELPGPELSGEEAEARLGRAW